MLKIPDPTLHSNVRPDSLPSAASLLDVPELLEVSLMYCKGTGRFGVSARGGRFVCQLPAGYNRHCGVLPQDGKLIVTLPGLPTLVADPMTGRVRTQ